MFAGSARLPPRPDSLGFLRPAGVVVMGGLTIAGGAYLSMELCSINEEQRLWEPPEDD